MQSTLSVTRFVFTLFRTKFCDLVRFACDILKNCNFFQNATKPRESTRRTIWTIIVAAKAVRSTIFSNFCLGAKLIYMNFRAIFESFPILFPKRIKAAWVNRRDHRSSGEIAQILKVLSCPPVNVHAFSGYILDCLFKTQIRTGAQEGPYGSW